MGFLLLIGVFAGAIYVAVTYSKSNGAGEISKPKKWVYLIFSGAVFLVSQITIFCNLSTFTKTELNSGLIFSKSFATLVYFYFIIMLALLFSVVFSYFKKNANPFLLFAISLIVPILIYNINFQLFSGPLGFIADGDYNRNGYADTYDASQAAKQMKRTVVIGPEQIEGENYPIELDSVKLTITGSGNLENIMIHSDSNIYLDAYVSGLGGCDYQEVTFDFKIKPNYDASKCKVFINVDTYNDKIDLMNTTLVDDNTIRLVMSKQEIEKYRGTSFAVCQYRMDEDLDYKLK